MPGCLFAADSYLTWWENGVFNVDWWNLRNGGDGSRTTNDDGTIGYQDEGIVSSGTSGEPALNTPFPPSYGLTLAAETGAPGDTLVSATSADPAVVAHAVRTASGGVNVLLINKDLYNSATISVDYSGFTPGGEAAVRQWSKGATGIGTATRSPTGGITVPAYSITLVRADGETAAPPGTEARTGALRGVGPGRCLDVADAADGTPATIRSCDGAVGQQWALTSTGALRVHGTRCLGVPEGAPAVPTPRSPPAPVPPPSGGRSAPTVSSSTRARGWCSTSSASARRTAPRSASGPGTGAPTRSGSGGEPLTASVGPAVSR